MCFHKNLATQQHLHLHFIGKGRCTKWFHDVHKLKIEHHAQKWHRLEKFPIFQKSGSRPWAALTSCEFGSIHGKYTLQERVHIPPGEKEHHRLKSDLISGICDRSHEGKRPEQICHLFFGRNFVSCIALISVFLFHVKRLSRSWHPLRSLWPGEWKQSLHFAARTFNWRWSRHLNPSSTRFAANCWGGRNGTL